MACVCGHAEEEHGGNPKYPGSTACVSGELEDDGGECDCVAYEADDEEEED